MLETFGKRLRDLRKEKGISGYKLAQLSGIPDSHIAVLESGKRAATPAVIAKLAPHLGISAEEMQSWADADALGPERLATLVAANADLAPLFYLAHDANRPDQILWFTLPSGEKVLPVFTSKDTVYRSNLVPGFLVAEPVLKCHLPDRLTRWAADGFSHVVIDVAKDRNDGIVLIPLGHFRETWIGREIEPGPANVADGTPLE